MVPLRLSDWSHISISSATSINTHTLKNEQLLLTTLDITSPDVNDDFAGVVLATFLVFNQNLVLSWLHIASVDED